MKSVYPALFVIGLLSPAVADTFGGGAMLPVAYVSMQRVANESIEAKAASARLEKLRQDKSREVSERQKTLDATHLKLVQAGGLFQASKRAQLKVEEDRQRAELQRVSQEAQTELQNLQHQLQNDLKSQLASILEEITKRRRLQLILNQDAAVVWSFNAFDLTGEVLEKLNAKAAKPPAPR